MQQQTPLSVSLPIHLYMQWFLILKHWCKDCQSQETDGFQTALLLSLKPESVINVSENISQKTYRGEPVFE